MTDSTARRPRVHTVGIPRRDDELLVERYTTGEEPFYRPIGGGIEFGEHSHEAVVREFREETGYEVEPVELLGVAENVYEFAGTPGHEVSFVYEVAFVADDPYQRERLTVDEASDEETRTATWHTPADLRSGPEPCYPTGLFDLLADAERVASRGGGVTDSGSRTG
ncbi:NUDIX hydrolase [Halobacteriales archaeon QS_9_67_17]|nr:MAG: NUDIX hydrolase [Halobacteriales archaeon QS_9_67_17]